MYERNGVETIEDSDGILWLNEKHIKEGLDNKDLRPTTVKFLSNQRKKDLVVDEPKHEKTV